MNECLHHPLPTKHELQEALEYLIKVGRIQCILLCSNRIFYTNLSNGKRVRKRKVIGTIFLDIAVPKTNCYLSQKATGKHAQLSCLTKRSRKEPIRCSFLNDIINVMYPIDSHTNATMNTKSLNVRRDYNACNMNMFSPKTAVKGMSQRIKDKVHGEKKVGVTKKETKGPSDQFKGKKEEGALSPDKVKKSFFQNIKETAGSVPNILKKKDTEDRQSGKKKGISFVKDKIGTVTEKLNRKKGKKENKNTKTHSKVKSLAGKPLNETNIGRKAVETSKSPHSRNDKASDTAKDTDLKNKAKNDDLQPKPIYITKDPTEDKSEEEETPPLFTYEYAQPWTMPLGSGCACHGCPHFPGHHKRPDSSSTSSDSCASRGWYTRQRRRKHRKRKHVKGDRISDSSVSTFTFSNPNSYMEDFMHDLATTLLHKQEIQALISRKIESANHHVHKHE